MICKFLFMLMDCMHSYFFVLLGFFGVFFIIIIIISFV